MRLKHLLSVFLTLLTLGVGQMWGTHTVIKAGDMVSGQKYIIAAGTDYYLIPNSYSEGASGSLGTYSSTLTEAAAWTFTKSGDYWYISTVVNKNTVYLGHNSKNNGVRTNASSQAYTISETSSGASTVYLVANSRYLSCTPSNSNWRCYGNTNTGTVTLTLYRVDAATGPTITKSSSMTTLTYSNGSPVAQYFTVGGTNLTNNVTVTAPANGKYEVSTSQNSGYGNSVELSKGNGTLANTNVYIRLKSGLAGGNISADNISITSTGATAQTISVSGSVPYTITWMANGSEHATTYVAVGSTLALPATDPVPNTCGCTGKAFFGWYGGGTSYKNASVAPSIAVAGDAVNADKTYYAVFADASDGGSTTKWVLTALSAVTEGTYALVNQTNHAFNGTINSSGHGDCTTGTFTFVNDEATSAPTGTCEIVFEAVTGGFKMKMGNNYLYASKAGSGGFSSHSTENSYWKYASSNWTYNSNSAYLRSYNATTGGLRVYGANNGDGVLRLAKKTTVSSVTYSNYETSCCTPLASINGSFFRYHFWGPFGDILDQPNSLTENR